MTSKTFKRRVIARLFLRYWPWVLITVATTLSTGYFRSLGAQYVQVITDHVQTLGGTGLWPVIGITCLIQAVNYSTKSIAAICCMRLTAFLTVDLRVRLMRVFHSIPLLSFEKRSVGDLQSVLHNDTSKAADYVYMVFSRIGTSIITGLFTFFFMARANWQAAAAVLAISVSLGYVNNRILKRIKQNERTARGALGDLTACLTESYDSADSVKIFGADNYVLSLFAGIRARYNKAALNVEAIDAARLGLYAVVNNVTLYGSIIFLSWQVLRGSGTLGEALAFITLLTQALVSIEMIFRWSGRVAICNVSWDRVGEIVSLRADAAQAEAPRGPRPAVSSLRVENLDFSYDGDRKILDCLSFEVTKGKVYRIPGESGSGKTTLIKCLLGLYEAPGAKAIIDGTVVNAQDAGRLAAFVPSESFLFAGSVYDNLTLGDAVSPSECFAAADSIGAGEWLRSLPYGLDAQVETGGENFSGGQRQMLCVLRALLTNRPILIMDEPFSALDAERSQRLAQMLADIATGRIVIITSHKNDALPFADIFGESA